MPEVVYISAALLSFACSVLLFRGYTRNGVRLLFWSALCFVALAVNNTLLFLDLVVVGPNIDLSLIRGLAGLVGLSLLVHALVAESS
jgi:hypothetical protein